MEDLGELPCVNRERLLMTVQWAWVGELEGGGGCEGGVGGRRPGLLEADSWAPGYCPKAQYAKCTVKCLRGNKPIGSPFHVPGALIRPFR